MSVRLFEYRFGFYYVLPLTAPIVIATPDYDVPATTISSETDSCVITFGDYNVRTADCLLSIATQKSSSG